MKKIIFTLSTILVILALMATILFGYAQIKKNLENNKTTENKQEQQLSNSNQDNSQANNDSQNTQNQENDDPWLGDQRKQEEINKQKLSNQTEKVNRDNVFDYVIEAMNSKRSDGEDVRDFVNFKEPQYNEDSGLWEVDSYNKSGAGGGQHITVDQGGTVTVWNGIQTDVEYTKKIDLHQEALR